MGLSETSFPFLARLTEASRRALRSLPTSRARANQRVLERGHAVNGAYFVLRGELRVYYITAEGREATLYDVEAGAACILALTSAFNDEPYPAWVQARSTGAEFISIPTPLLHKLIDDEPAFRAFVFGELSGRVYDLMQRLEETGSATIEQRVARHLLRRAGADGIVRASQVRIASELGTAREVVFRALRALSERGFVKTARLRVTILDRRALTQLSRPPRSEK
jgi:CRP/FNR family transcriptional regulator, anaerobic regulatory protein